MMGKASGRGKYERESGGVCVFSSKRNGMRSIAEK